MSILLNHDNMRIGWLERENVAPTFVVNKARLKKETWLFNNIYFKNLPIKLNKYYTIDYSTLKLNWHVRIQMVILRTQKKYALE